MMESLSMIVHRAIVPDRFMLGMLARVSVPALGLAAGIVGIAAGFAYSDRLILPFEISVAPEILAVAVAVALTFTSAVVTFLFESRLSRRQVSLAEELHCLDEKNRLDLLVSLEHLRRLRAATEQAQDISLKEAIEDREREMREVIELIERGRAARAAVGSQSENSTQ